jgi:hypothetical protein
MPLYFSDNRSLKFLSYIKGDENDICTASTFWLNSPRLLVRAQILRKEAETQCSKRKSTVAPPQTAQGTERRASG